MLKTMELTDFVELQLRSLCMTGKYIGLPYLISAVCRVVIDPEKISYLTKVLYREVAKEFGTTSAGVERAIRTAITANWDRGGREALNQLIGRQLVERPTNCEYIDMLAAHIRITTRFAQAEAAPKES